MRAVSGHGCTLVVLIDKASLGPFGIVDQYHEGAAMKPCEKCGGYVVPDYTDDSDIRMLHNRCVNCGKRNELACATFTAVDTSVV